MAISKTSPEFKIMLGPIYIQGASISLTKDYGIGHTALQSWIKKDREHGEVCFYSKPGYTHYEIWKQNLETNRCCFSRIHFGLLEVIMPLVSGEWASIAVYGILFLIVGLLFCGVLGEEWKIFRSGALAD